jgi:hypothetical protein
LDETVNGFVAARAVVEKATRTQASRRFIDSPLGSRLRRLVAM